MNLELEQSSFIRELNSFLEYPLTPFMENKVKSMLNDFYKKVVKDNKPVMTKPEIRIIEKVVYRTLPMRIKQQNSVVSITIDNIINLISWYLNIDIKKIRMVNRQRELVYARKLIYYFARKYTYCSLKHISMYVNGQDHTTVIHALSTLRDLIDTEPSVGLDIDKINAIILERFPLAKSNLVEIPEFPFPNKLSIAR